MDGQHTSIADVFMKSLVRNYSYVFCDCGTKRQGMSSTCAVLCPDRESSDIVANIFRPSSKVTQMEGSGNDTREFFRDFKPDMVVFVRVETLDMAKVIESALDGEQYSKSIQKSIYQYSIFHNPAWLNNYLMRYYGRMVENDTVTIFLRTND